MSGSNTVFTKRELIKLKKLVASTSYLFTPKLSIVVLKLKYCIFKICLSKVKVVKSF